MPFRRSLVPLSKPFCDYIAGIFEAWRLYYFTPFQLYMAHSQWKMVSIRKQAKFRHSTTTKPKTGGYYVRPYYQDLCPSKNKLLPQNVNMTWLAHKVAKVSSNSFSKAQRSRSASFYGRALGAIRNKLRGCFIRSNKPLQLLKITRQLKSKLYPKIGRYWARPFTAWNKTQRHIIRYRFRQLKTKNLRGRKPFRRLGKRRPRYISRQTKIK